jgi:hypothetical protein
VPFIDYHGCTFPREGCSASSTWVFLGLFVPSERPRGHEILHDAIVLELVLDRVCMVWAGLLKESIDVVYRWSHLALDTTPGGHDVLRVRVVYFLVYVIVSHGCNPLWAPLSPLLAALGNLLGALDDDAGWHRSAVPRDRFPGAWDRERLDHLLVGCVLGSDAEQLLIGVPDDAIWCPKA